MIASFYAALHYIEAEVVAHGHQSHSHSTRFDYFRSIPKLQPVRVDYMTLSDWAWKARYDPSIDFSRLENVQEICDLLDAVRQGLAL